MTDTSARDITDASVRIAVTRLGPFVLAIDANLIENIREIHALSTAEGIVDATTWLGMKAEPAGARRLVLRLMGTRDPVDLAVGGSAHIRDVPCRALHRLPTLLAGLGKDLGILGLVEIDDSFAFLLGVDAICNGPGDAGRQGD